MFTTFYKISSVLLSIIILLLACISIAGIFMRPSLGTTTLNPNSLSSFTTNCSVTRTLCNTNEDCSLCENGAVSYTCQPLSLGDGSLIPNIKACLPANAKQDVCDLTKGGMLTYEGWSGDTESASFQCVCGFPNYASVSKTTTDPTTGIATTVRCADFNADVCAGGTFDWNISMNEPPSAKHCTCPAPLVKMISRYGSKPSCVSAQGADTTYVSPDPATGPNWYTNYYDLAK